MRLLPYLWHTGSDRVPRVKRVQSARRHLKISQVYLTDIISHNSLYMYNNLTHHAAPRPRLTHKYRNVCSYLLFSVVCSSSPTHGHFPPLVLRPSADSSDGLSLSFLCFPLQLLHPNNNKREQQREQQQLQLNSPLLPLIVVSVCLFGPSCQSWAWTFY